jgi:hypothetical protein
LDLIHRIKALIASAASLLVGLVMGWYLEHRHSEHEQSEIILPRRMTEFFRAVRGSH